MRDAIELLTPFEDLIVDGSPATSTDVFPSMGEATVVSSQAILQLLVISGSILTDCL